MSGVELNNDKVTEFFNDLELKDDHSDLMLLLEAEKRKLLNPVCEQILLEARRRGWVKPLKGSSGRLEVYQVKYLGAMRIRGVLSGDDILSSHVSEAVSRITRNPRAAFQTHLLLEVHPESLRLFDVESKDRNEGSKTLKRLKNLTLRKILGQRSSGSTTDITKTNTSDCELVIEHDREKIIRFLSFDRIVAVVVKEMDFTDKLVFNCHAYKLKNQSMAFEVADHLRVTHEGILNQRESRKKKRYPRERVTLSCHDNSGHYGIHLIGPSTRVEAATGVFILKIDKDSVAARHKGLKEGLQVLSVNGIDTEDVTVAECREQILASTSSVVLDLQENPFGFGLHQYEKGVRKPTVSYHLNNDTDETRIDGVELNRSTDNSNNVTVVDGMVLDNSTGHSHRKESQVDGIALKEMGNIKSVDIDAGHRNLKSIASDHISSNDHRSYDLVDDDDDDEEEEEDEEEDEDNGVIQRRTNKRSNDDEENEQMRQRRLSSQVDEVTQGFLDLSVDASFTSSSNNIVPSSSW
eukprot:m.84556 g.84556  ORF g.84556 m.84556 type:complete len:522 (-) comp12161_c0_seq3:167-1732(-)